MQYSSAAMRLFFLLTASVSLSGLNAFVAPHSKSTRGFAFTPPLTVQSSASTTSLHLSTSRKIIKIATLFKDLDDLADYDPEDADADRNKTEFILNLTLKVLENILDKETDILEDHTPSLEGLEKEDAEKDIESALGGVLEQVKNLIEYYVTDGHRETLELTTYPAHPEFPTVSLAGLPKMMVGPPPVEYIFAPKDIVGILKKIIGSTVGNSIVYKKAQQLELEGKSEEAFEALFTESHLGYFGLIPNKLDFIPKPEQTMKTWEDDEEQGRQFLNGVNPVMIRVVNDVGDFSEAIAEELGNTYNLQRLIDEKRLFYVSYDELDDYKINPHQAYPSAMNPNKEKELNWELYFNPAVAVFVLSDDRKELVPKAIQLERTPGAKVYSRKDKTEWLFAKAQLATADSQYHEWVSHLGMTHLATEAHVVAVHNILKKHNHKLYTFLKPLCKSTLLLNYGARSSLASYDADSDGDQLSSLGVGQYLQMVLKKWQTYDFFKSSGLPSELESRGFTEDFDMPAYHYRTDGMKLWKAYGSFATNFVDELYESDADISADEVVQEWARETSYADKGAIPGFPTSFSDKETLSKVLQTLMWMVSGLHCAVNFPQYDMLAYVPNKPLCGRACAADFPSDADEETQRKWIFNEYMPNIATAKLTIETTLALTYLSDHTINRLDKQFASVGKVSYESFKNELDHIGNEITARNTESERNGEATYHYLHPDFVTASIDI